MKSSINSLKYIFLGLLLLGSSSFAAYDFLYQIPKEKCDAAGGWWTFKYHQCIQPMKVVDFPGYKPDHQVATTAKSAPAAKPATHP